MAVVRGGEVDAHGQHGCADADAQRRRSCGQGGALAEQVDLDAAAGDVAVGHEPDCLVAAKRGQELNAGVFEGHDSDAHRGPGRVDVPLHASVGDALHGAHDAAQAVDGEDAGHLDRPEMQADEDQRLALDQPRLDFLGSLVVKPLEDPARGELGRSSHLHVVAGVVDEDRSDELLERLGVRCRGAVRLRSLAVGRHPLDDAAEVSAGPSPTGGRKVVRDAAAEVGHCPHRPFRQVQDELQRADDEEGGQALGQPAPKSAPRGGRFACRRGRRPGHCSGRFGVSPASTAGATSVAVPPDP